MKDVCKRDMQTVGLREGDEGDRAYWKEATNMREHTHTPPSPPPYRLALFIGAHP